MKKIFYLSNLILFLITLLSCENSDNLSEIKSNNNTLSSLSAKKEYHIYFADWDEWGRSSKSCNGWGLCNFRDCWSCCVDEGVILNCNEKTVNYNSGKVVLDSETKQGFLIIELNINNNIQKQAIINKEILSLDNDLTSTKTILHKGEYVFDSSIGKYGGYKINASGL